MSTRALAVLQIVALMLAAVSVIGFAVTVIWLSRVAQDFVLVTGFFAALIAGHA